MVIIYELSHYKDIDDKVAPIILKYYEYMNANDFKSAAQILKDNSEVLEPYRIDMNVINKIEAGLHDLWEIATAKQTVVVTEDENEPVGRYPVGTQWYAEY